MESPRGPNDRKSSHEYHFSISRHSSRFDETATKRLVRKIDVYLMPILALLYLLSFLDRSNIGNARLAGLEKDLKMRGLDYNVALTIFFPFYVLAEIPSNLIMQTHPRLWVPSIMVAWGTMCCLMGIVNNYAGLLAIRAALGLAEGGLFPGINYYITRWYKRHECGFRMSLFFSAATAAGAFGGLLARAIMQMDKVRGLSAWSWIFIIEGVVTIIIALWAYFLMHDYPDTAKFLTEKEREEVARRLDDDQFSLDDTAKSKYFWDAVADWKIWVHMFIALGIYSPLYSFSLFIPTIIKDLGYTNNAAQLMSVPPYAVACILCILVGWLTDRTGQRGTWMIAFNLVGILGFAIQIGANTPKYKYMGTFFAAAGIYPSVPQTVAWNGNNIGGSSKRAVGLAMQTAFGNLGGVLSAFTYTAQDQRSGYKRGHSIVIGLLGMSTVLAAIMHVWCYLENKRRDRVDSSNGRAGGWPEEDKLREKEKGDGAGFFRYTT